MVFSVPCPMKIISIQACIPHMRCSTPPVISSYSELKYRRQKHILLPARISEAKQLEKMPLLSDLQKLSCRPSTASPMKSAGSQPQAGFAPGKEAAAVTG